MINEKDFNIEEVELLWHWDEDAEILCGSEEEAIDDYLDVHCDTVLKTGTIRLYAYQRMDIKGLLSPKHLVEGILEDLDQDHGDPDNYSMPTAKMISAAQKLIDAIEKDYFVWACVRAPQYDYDFEYDENF